MVQFSGIKRLKFRDSGVETRARRHLRHTRWGGVGWHGHGMQAWQRMGFDNDLANRSKNSLPTPYSPEEQLQLLLTMQKWLFLRLYLFVDLLMPDLLCTAH